MENLSDTKQKIFSKRNIVGHKIREKQNGQEEMLI